MLGGGWGVLFCDGHWAAEPGLKGRGGRMGHEDAQAMRAGARRVTAGSQK